MCRNKQSVKPGIFSFSQSSADNKCPLEVKINLTSSSRDPQPRQEEYKPARETKDSKQPQKASKSGKQSLKQYNDRRNTLTGKRRGVKCKEKRQSTQHTDRHITITGRQEHGERERGWTTSIMANTTPPATRERWKLGSVPFTPTRPKPKPSWDHLWLPLLCASCFKRLHLLKLTKRKRK